jgi:hypothetical protein
MRRPIRLTPGDLVSASHDQVSDPIENCAGRLARSCDRFDPDERRADQCDEDDSRAETMAIHVALHAFARWGDRAMRVWRRCPPKRSIPALATRSTPWTDTTAGWCRSAGWASAGSSVGVIPLIASTAPIVRNMDRGAAIRIRAAIEATLREQGSYPSYDDGLIEADARFRSAIHELVKDESGLVAEFDTIFPPAEPRSRRGGLAGGELLEGSGMTKSARMHLAGMSGWLQGLIEIPGGRPA